MPETQTRSPRLQHASSPDAVAGVQQIMKAIYAGGVPQETLELVHMRASQINGCNACIASGIKNAERIGLAGERLLTLPAWRESVLYDDAERAALGLAEAMTRLADHPDVVTEEIWADAAEQFDERALSALVSMIALTNFFNRVNTFCHGVAVFLIFVYVALHGSLRCLDTRQTFNNKRMVHVAVQCTVLHIPLYLGNSRLNTFNRPLHAGYAFNRISHFCHVSMLRNPAIKYQNVYTMYTSSKQN